MVPTAYFILFSDAGTYVHAYIYVGFSVYFLVKIDCKLVINPPHAYGSLNDSHILRSKVNILWYYNKIIYRQRAHVYSDKIR